MAWRLVLVRALVVLFLLPALAGCISPGDGAADPQGEPLGDAEGSDGAVPQNRFLLDDVRPFNAAVSRGAEPAMLVDQDGNFLWIGDTSGVYRSTDGGATWLRSRDPFLPGLFTDGWTLAQDEVGRLYASTTRGQVIGLGVSEDGGASWSHVNQLVHAGVVADRPWLAARGDGEVALIQNFNGMDEHCAFSSDAGQTFLQRDVLNAGSPNPGNAVFDKDGRLYYAIESSVYRYSRPCAGGVLAMPLPASGAQIFTQVAVDDAGDVYVAQPSPDNSAMELRGTHGLLASSMRRLAVSPPVLESNTFGTLSVHGDEIAVAWYGSETAGNPSDPAFSGAWNVYVARVTGFWSDAPVIEYTRLTTEPNHVGDFCMGGIGCTGGGGDRDLLDYMMVDHDAQGGLHVAYGHDGTGRASQVRYAYVP